MKRNETRRERQGRTLGHDPGLGFVLLRDPMLVDPARSRSSDRSRSTSIRRQARRPGRNSRGRGRGDLQVRSIEGTPVEHQGGPRGGFLGKGDVRRVSGLLEGRDGPAEEEEVFDLVFRGFGGEPGDL